MIGSIGLCGGVTLWPGARDAATEKEPAHARQYYAALAQLCASIRARERARNKESVTSVFGVSCDLHTEAAAISVTCPAFVPCRHWDLHLTRVFARDVVLLSQLNAPARLKFKTPDL